MNTEEKNERRKRRLRNYERSHKRLLNYDRWPKWTENAAPSYDDLEEMELIKSEDEILDRYRRVLSLIGQAVLAIDDDQESAAEIRAQLLIKLLEECMVAQKFAADTGNEWYQPRNFPDMPVADLEVLMLGSPFDDPGCFRL